MVIVTFLLAVIATIQLVLLARAQKIAEESADAAKKSAEVAERTLLATQRAWLSIRPTIGSDLVFNETEGGRLTIICTVKNVGNAPAIGTEIHIRIFPEVLLFAQASKIREKQMELCRVEARKSLPPEKHSIGFILFPNEEFVYSITTTISREEINQSWDEISKRWKIEKDLRNEPISPELIGCVSYRFTVDESAIHTTAFAADLVADDPNEHRSAFSGVSNAAGTIPASMLKLQYNLFGAYAD